MERNLNNIFKKRSTIILFVILFLVLIVSTNRLIRSTLKGGTSLMVNEHSESINVTVAQPSKTFSRPAAKYHVTSEDPSKYGISVQTKGRMPRNETQWDRYAKEILIQPKTVAHMEERGAFEVMRTTPKEFQKRMREINGRIKIYEETKKKNPGEHSIDKKLENLYLLRSTLTTLKDKIIIKPSNKDMSD